MSENKPQPRRMSTEEELICLKEDVGSLLEYAQKLIAENKNLRAILERAVVFFENREMEELYTSITEENHSFPTLRTKLKAEDCYHSTLYSSDVDANCVADDEPNSTHVQENGLPQSTVHTSHSVSTVTASASSSQTLSGSGNGRSIEVPQNKSPLKKSRSDLTGHSQESESGGRDGVSISLDIMVGRMGGDGKAQHHGLYISDLANLMMKMSELEERMKPKAGTDVVSLTGEDVTDIVIAGCTQQQNEHVFVVHTTWTNGQRFELYRKYKDFFTLQNTLQKLFPEETGTDVSQQKQNLLPLRDHVLCTVGRLNSKRSLKSREKMVNNYCKVNCARFPQAVVVAPCSAPVINFFMPTAGDMQLQSIRKATMACFVSPTCQLPAGAQFIECIVIASHEASSDNELSVKKGEVVTVLNRETTGWSLVMKPGEKGSRESKVLGYVPSTFLKQKEDKAGLENTAELEKECLGFISSVAAQEEAQWFRLYGSFNGFPSTSPATHTLKASPIPSLRRVLLSEPDIELDSSDGNELGDNSSSLKGAVVDHEAAEKLPTGLSIGRLRRKGYAEARPPLTTVTSLPPPSTDPDDPDVLYLPCDAHGGQSSSSANARSASDRSMRCRKNDFTRHRIMVARRKALAIMSGSTDWERRSPSILEKHVREDVVRTASTPTSSSKLECQLTVNDKE